MNTLCRMGHIAMLVWVLMKRLSKSWTILQSILLNSASNKEVSKTSPTDFTIQSSFLQYGHEHMYVCNFCEGCWWGRRRRQTAGVKFYKWGRKWLYCRSIQTPTTFFSSPSWSLCVWYVCIYVGVCGIWARRWLSLLPSRVSLTGPSRRAASLYPPQTGQQPSWHSHSPANTSHAFNPQSAALILMKEGWGVITKETRRDNELKKNNIFHPFTKQGFWMNDTLWCCNAEYSSAAFTCIVRPP